MRSSHLLTRIICYAALLLVAQSARRAQAQGSVTGRVTDRAQQPIVDAEVEISAISARTRTDSTGRFRFRVVSPGLHRIDVRRLGFAPSSTEVRVRDRDSVTVHVFLLQRAQLLPSIPVEGAPSSDVRLKDFERRRSSGVGQFLTVADLGPERSKPLGDVLVRLRGTYVVRSSLAACLTSTRGAQSIQNSATGWCGNQPIGAGYCPVAVFVDGHPAYAGHSEDIFNLNSLRADELAGVEFYSGSGTLPREFSAPSGTCGALVIWRKN
jgi:hypothetical protein